MTKHLLVPVFLALLLTNVEQVGAQRAPRGREKSTLGLTFCRHPTLQPDSVRLDIFTRISLDRLVFLAHEGGFLATYEVSLFAMDEDEMVIGTRIWRETVVRQTYKETQAEDEHHVAQTGMNLPLGTFHIVANLWDTENRQRYTVREELEIEAYPEDELALGDILVVAGVEQLPGRQDRINPYFKDDYAGEIDSLRIYFVVRNPRPEPAVASTRYLFTVDDEDTLSVITGTLALGKGISTHVVPFSTRKLKDRDHALTLALRLDSLEAERTVSVDLAGGGLSLESKDLDEAISQTRYVASRKQLEKMRSAKGEAKREALLAFWRSQDPTPDSPHNELMDEYYRRVAYSNAHFRSFQSGWETDLGMVYIIYGKPDDIERHPFGMQQKPYQVWFYYAKGWRFVFVDANMFGDYRLMTPLYPNRSF